MRQDRHSHLLAVQRPAIHAARDTRHTALRFEPASDRVEPAEGRLREAREHGLTHAEAARALGRPQSFVAKIEAGQRRVKVIDQRDPTRRYSRDAWSMKALRAPVTYRQDGALGGIDLVKRLDGSRGGK